MDKWRGIRTVAFSYYRQGLANRRLGLTLALAFVLCYLLTEKAVRFASENGTTMQIMEGFVWTFADADSILLTSALLILLFADMPFLSPATPFLLVRINRRIWLAGQALHITMTSVLYLGFVLFTTGLLCMTRSFAGNQWSETAAILAYSGAGKNNALPAAVKTLEMSTPYGAAAVIFALMVAYALLLVHLMLALNIRFGPLAAIGGVFLFVLTGYLLKPDLLITVYRLPDLLAYRAKIAVGWISPLNHATFSMHNFGYDQLPRIWQTFALFSVLLLILYRYALRAVRRYPFNFRGNED